MAASKMNHMYDALLALRSLTDRATPVTANGVGGGFVPLHQITSGGSTTPVPGLPGALGDLVGLFGQNPFDVVFYIDNVDTTSGSETYTLKLQSVDANKANPVDVPGGSVVISQGMVAEPFVLKIDPHTIKLSNDAAQFIQVAHVLGGTTPAMSYFAYASRDNEAS